MDGTYRFCACVNNGERRNYRTLTDKRQTGEQQGELLDLPLLIKKVKLIHS